MYSISYSTHLAKACAVSLHSVLMQSLVANCLAELGDCDYLGSTKSDYEYLVFLIVQLLFSILQIS